ncbi:MAG: HlyC/CorC family transporter [Planctomycetales bacterium]|nr:HlyC/CorC family transporter [Planctomycetales bacterium]
MFLLLLAVLFALSLSALCSLMEATLLSLTPSQVATISSKRPKLGKIWQQFKQQIDRPISVILIVNTAAHTVGATIAGAEFDKQFGPQWIWVFSLIFTFLMLQFTEILPKTMGVRYASAIATLTGRPLQFLVNVFHPLILVIRWINRPLEGATDPHQRPATLDEIAALAGMARLSRQITKHEERIITYGSRLSQLSVRDVMIPLPQVSFLSTSQSLNEAMLAAHMDAHTRYPLCEQGDPNRILGYVNFKEIVYSLRFNPQSATLHGIARPVRMMDADQPAARLLQAFVDEHAHIAIVHDAQGKTLGMVTLEDLVEEFLGELEDEFDRLPRMIHALGGDLWMIGGGVQVAEINHSLGLKLDETELALSPWLEKRLAKPLKPNDEIVENGVRFTVRRIRRGKVFEASIRKVDGLANQDHTENPQSQ